MSIEALRSRITNVVTMFVVTTVSLFVLVYVGFAEGRRVYEKLHLETLNAEARAVQGVIENYLRVGSPLHQYTGFTNVAEPVAQFKEVDAIVVYDDSGRELFRAVDKSKPKIPEPAPAILHLRSQGMTEIGPTHYQIIVPLRTRFETVGSLVIFGPTAVVSARLESTFRFIAYIALGLSAAFAIFLFVGAPQFVKRKSPWLQIAYAVVFLAMTGVIVDNLVKLYSEGVQGRVHSSAAVFAQRLAEIAKLKLRFRDFDGLENAFSEYRRLNPSISSASLIIENVAKISTNPNKLQKAWVPEPGTYEVEFELSGPELIPAKLVVAAPMSLVYEEVLRSVRNFVALFVACGFLAGLFLQIVNATQSDTRRVNEPKFAPEENKEAAYIYVKPIFFLAIFIENMMYSFLPQFMKEVALQSGKSASWAIVPFVGYYLAFALTLIPAGYMADRRGPKRMICVGGMLASLSLMAMVGHLEIFSLTALRALAGIGQAMLFIGIQTYILAVTPPEKKTQGAAIIVFGFQGGMIAGMAIGSLLVVYLQPHGVFLLSGAIGFATVIYSLILVPQDSIRSDPKIGFNMAVRQVAANLGQVIRNAHFLRTMICIGIPAKAVLTGAITFAIPLLLGKQGYRHEDIGQILMLYGIGVIAASTYVSRRVDRTGNSQRALFWGASASGIGLVIAGVGGSSVIGEGTIGALVVTVGVVIVGLAHGFINAPVITHITQSDLALQIGVSPVAAAYRFLERVGHIAGPLLLGHVFITWGENAQILAWIGFIVIGLGFAFNFGTAPTVRTGLELKVAK